METQLSPKEDKVFEIIDRVLKQVFGETSTRIIYEYLERRHSLTPSDFSEKMDVFAKGLEEFLNSGAYFIENKILNDIIAAYNSQQTLELQIAVDVEEPDFASPSNPASSFLSKQNNFIFNSDYRYANMPRERMRIS